MKCDVLVIGGGIVGLASARQLLQRRPGLSLVVVEKEDALARHQTGRNSGVIHSGLYYKPGSLKATTCHRGRQKLIDYCRENNLPFELCGKVVVATQESQRPRLDELERRGLANGVTLQRLSPEELKEREPYCRAVDSMFVADTGIADYAAVCQSLNREITKDGDVRLRHPVTRFTPTADGIDIVCGETVVTASVVLNCGGLHCDRIYRMAGGKADVRIVPFRGEYYLLKESAEKFCRNLIYPVPDPRFPFLGVHLTRRIGGRVDCGPNAVLAFAREGYRFRDFRVKDLMETLSFKGFRTLARKHLRTGAAEMRRSLSRNAFAAAVRELVPDLRADDLVPGPAGVRAQAVRGDGSLVDDFWIAETERAVHVLNAPSPAATASLEIGDRVAKTVLAHLDRRRPTVAAV